MYILITLHEGARSSGAINHAKFGIFAENALFSATLVNVETRHAYRRCIGHVT